MGDQCGHLDQVDVGAEPSGEGCVECLRKGGRWVHLRMCRSCGHVGCCDSSPGRHATGHYREAGHPVVSSFEPGEDWWWCYADELTFGVEGAPDYAHS
ncbi:UBP-type zinc finger domain-containing protein [Actinocorallia libanotica]